MCRFLLLTAPEPCDVAPIVAQFAAMCHRSRGSDGDWQGDGWGVAWWHTGDTWQRHRSVAPIWTETDVIQQLPPTCHLVVHARSASFAHQKGNVAYNQPYVWGTYAFVFNGFMQGVRLPRKIPGAIGAEKIRYLVQEQLQQGVALGQALQAVGDMLAQHSREVRACNLGLSNGHEYVTYNGNPRGVAYYQLHHTQHDTLRMTSSEPFGPWAWR
jgi:predicted glutamine amidotransferase